MTETLTQWLLASQQPTHAGMTLTTLPQLSVMLIGVLMTALYLMPSMLVKSGWQLNFCNQPTDDSRVATLAMSWGLVWRLTV